MDTHTRTSLCSTKLYEKLIALYPPSYLNKHRDELVQNFEDLQRDIRPSKFFWAFIISDLITSVGMQYMEYIKRHVWAQLAIAAIIVLASLSAWQLVVLHKAHSSFDNYAAFRGCETITSRTDTSGACTLASGQTITIVEFQGRWFLQGDLPCGSGICW